MTCQHSFAKWYLIQDRDLGILAYGVCVDCGHVTDELIPARAPAKCPVWAVAHV
jgi:hypothetical protein